ncbi:toxin glutamine deamidase domain-containing protein [Streptomyces sp. NPDC059701]|uniref:toxin glutamine deamidase domain-containing protein n=1 Tax=Streptomyces sp. NPDC059701 TaxID=3346914 RepID=UPI0036C4CCA2
MADGWTLATRFSRLREDARLLRASEPCALGSTVARTGDPAGDLSRRGLRAGSTAPIEALYGGRQFKASTLSGIVNQIKKAGNGARGIVMSQKGRQAHVFNVVNIKGDVVFLDGQSGHADLSPWRNFSLLRTD